jgi:hypothetical protein
MQYSISNISGKKMICNEKSKHALRNVYASAKENGR